MCSFSGSSALHPGTFESKWVKFQRILSAGSGICPSLRAGLFVKLFAGVWFFFLRQIHLKVALRKRWHSQPERTVGNAGTEPHKSSRQISSPACKNVPDVCRTPFLWWQCPTFSEVENWSGAEPVKASETSDCNSMSGQGVWNRGDGRSERKNNCSHMQNNLLPGEIPKPYPLTLGSGGWSEDQGLGLLSSHLCSFQVPPCSLWRDENQHVLTLRLSLLTVNLDFNLFLSALPSAAYFMSSIFHICRGVSSFNSPRFLKSPFCTFFLSILPPPLHPC